MTSLPSRVTAPHSLVSLAGLLREHSILGLCYCPEAEALLRGQVADPSVLVPGPMLSRAIAPGQADQEDPGYDGRECCTGKGQQRRKQSRKTAGRLRRNLRQGNKKF